MVVLDGVRTYAVCLDDDSLLKLLELIPALKPYKSLIEMLIAELGHIPAEVFSGMSFVSISSGIRSCDLDRGEWSIYFREFYLLVKSFPS